MKVSAQPGNFEERKIRKRLRLRIFLSLILGCLFCVGGYAIWYTHRPQPPDIRVELFPGVVYYREAHQSPRPMMVHIVTVELERPGVSLLVTPGDPNQSRPLRARKTSQFLKEFGVQVAVNGDFFFPWWSHAPWNYYPHVGEPVELEGHAAAHGLIYSFGGERWKFPVLYFTRNNRGVFNRIPGEMENAIAGNVMILENGRIPKRIDPKTDHLDPRTAIALDKDSRKLILAVVDGRQPNYSEGILMVELSKILLRFGAYNALNLDGGGSTTLVVEGKNGKPNILNSPIDCRIPGRERPVANHFGVFVPKNAP